MLFSTKVVDQSGVIVLLANQNVVLTFDIDWQL